ncbi:MAG: DUF3089 domain-containing protein [Oligoflexus sp.]
MYKWILVLAGILLSLFLLNVFSFQIAFLMMTPYRSFDSLPQPPAPDYRDLDNWAAIPEKNELPPKPEADKPAVFYLQPTSFRSPFAWNESIVHPESTDRFAWIRQTQLSIFEDCCELYAPYYRQATLASYWSKEKGGDQARMLAYQDVQQAFAYFRDSLRPGQAFILAGHSQGTDHGIRLIREEIYGTPLMEQLVAAYLIGFLLPKAELKAELPELTSCQHAHDTGCLIGFSVFRQGTDNSDFTSRSEWFSNGAYRPSNSQEFLCINPLTWRENEELAGSELHLGALLDKEDAPATSAVCRQHVVYVDDLDEYLEWNLNGNYHVYDYGIFYENIKQNVSERIAAFRRKQSEKTDRQ